MSERELEGLKDGCVWMIDKQFKQFKKDFSKSLNLLKNRKIVYFSHYFSDGLGGSACWETTILQYKKSSGFFEVIDHVYYSSDSIFNFSAEIKNKYWDYVDKYWENKNTDDLIFHYSSGTFNTHESICSDSRINTTIGRFLSRYLRKIEYRSNQPMCVEKDILSFEVIEKEFFNIMS